MKLRFLKLFDSATIPTRAHQTDAGIDLIAINMVHNFQSDTLSYHTGLAVSIPKGYVGFLVPRSSIYRTKNWMVNSVGIIDSGYTGELIINMDIRQNAHEKAPVYKPGDRVAQLVIIKIPNIEIVEATRFNSTDRGSKGFGSSGT